MAMANRLKPLCAGASLSDFVTTFSLSSPKIVPYKLNVVGLKNCVRIKNNNKNRTTNRRLVLGGVCCLWSQFMNMFGLQKGNSFLASARQKSAVEEVLKTAEWPEQFPFKEEDFQRYDESNDTVFYDTPRFVTHIDDYAIAALTKYYSEVFPPSNTPGVSMLDICSSWVSHFPKGYKQERIVGMGMNEEELKRNPVLTEYIVQDLNINPKLPFEDNSFDVITNVVSVDYLTKPLEVFKEMRRILKPGGLAIMSFSNRCFWTKAISIWTSTGDADHVLIVGSYFHYAGGFEPPKDPEIRPLAEQDSDRLQQLLPEIPLWVKNPDYDRMDWLNKFIAQMWPYLDKAICKTVKDIAAPIIAEQIPKYKIDSVEFKKLSLGSLPPTFQGMKVYLTDEKELIMEPSLKWAGNPNVLVAVKAFGLRATAQVVDLQVFAAPRITLKPLVPSFPCFANIYVSLMERPHVDFGLKLLGADLMSIPGLYRFVQEQIKDQVANMYLWPRTLEVPILDPTKALRRPVGILHVKVLRAMKLRKKDLLGASDPYVKLKLTDDKTPSKKTTVKHKNLNPEWNEEFNLTVRDPETQILELSVYDWEQVGKHEKMGMNAVPLKDLTPDEPKEFTLDLLKTTDPNDPQNEKSRGQIVIEVTYKAFKEEDLGKEFDDSVQEAPAGTPAGGGVLVVRIHEGQDLEGKHHTNPYARVIFRGEGKKTKTVKKNRDPRWDEEFQFVLEEPPTQDKMHIEVTSTSKNLLHQKEPLGYIDISLSDVVNNKRINEKYNLIDSKNGRILVELLWRAAPSKS